LQSAIWQCLNNYDYADAVFLSERLYAEGEEVLLRNSQLLSMFIDESSHHICITGTSVSHTGIFWVFFDLGFRFYLPGYCVTFSIYYCYYHHNHILKRRVFRWQMKV